MTPLADSGPAEIAMAWRLSIQTAERLSWIHPFDRSRPPQGEAARRLAELARIHHLLLRRLGSASLVAAWLRVPNAELHGAAPLDWMTGATGRIVQMRMRLEAETAA